MKKIYLLAFILIAATSAGFAAQSNSQENTAKNKMVNFEYPANSIKNYCATQIAEFMVENEKIVINSVSVEQSNPEWVTCHIVGDVENTSGSIRTMKYEMRIISRPDVAQIQSEVQDRSSINE